MRKSVFLRIAYSFSALFLAAGLASAADAAPKGVTIYQTAKGTDGMTTNTSAKIEAAKADKSRVTISLDTAKTFQSITGFGAAFTEGSASLWLTLPKDKQDAIMKAYFSPDGAAFSLMRTHIGSCDFSLDFWSLDDTADDTNLTKFNIDRDKKYLIPFIKAAQAVPGAEFKLFASPWSPPAWMKENNNMVDGVLNVDLYPTYANYFVKYVKAYAGENIPIWGVTLQNEPEHGGNWETCKWTAFQQLAFIKNNVGPAFEKEKLDTKILIYDHNKDHVADWARIVLKDKKAAKYVYGTAFHWYDTYWGLSDNASPNFRFENVESVHDMFPTKHLLHTEGCVTTPIMLDDYWGKVRDWTGYLYIPAERYGIDIIGDLNAWAEGWVEWNLVLNTSGGPNHANNNICAPIVVNEDNTNVYYNPAYYILLQFSKFLRPGALRIGMAMANTNDTANLIATSFKNKDGKVVVEILNTNDNPVNYQVKLGKNGANAQIPGHAIQTVVME